MKKIMMLVVVGMMALGTAFAQDVAAAKKAFAAANAAYTTYINKNMNEELKAAKAEQTKALAAVTEAKVKILGADEKYADVVKAMEAAGDNKQAKAKATSAMEKAWKGAKKDKDPEFVKVFASLRTANQNVGKAEAAFRTSDAEAGKLWQARIDADKAVKDAVKAAAEAKKSAAGED